MFALYLPLAAYFSSDALPSLAPKPFRKERSANFALTEFYEVRFEKGSLRRLPTEPHAP